MSQSINVRDEEQEHLLDSIEVEEQVNSWQSTASLIVCAMAGVGCLGLPGAMNSSGWLGLPLLFIVAIFSAYTGIILGKAIEQTPRVRDYSEVGEEAFGRYGRLLSQFSVYLTLGGVAIIFLILLGILMHGIVPRVGNGFWTLVIGIAIASPLSIALKSYGEIKFVSWFGFAATASVVVVSCVLSLVFYFGDTYHDNVEHFGFHKTFIAGETFAIGFSVFTFAFGATAIFPNIYVKMVNREHWPRAIFGGYVASLCLYVPIAVVGYLVYGSYLAKTNTILDAISEFDQKTNVLVKICSGVMIAHIISAFPIVVNPIFLVLEGQFKSAQRFGSELIGRIVIRSVTLAILIVVALFFPYFLDVMSLLSCISVSLTGFILPCLFYWKICKPKIPEMILLTIIIVFGIVGSAVGIYVSMKGLIADVKHNTNPFKGLFEFD